MPMSTTRTALLVAASTGTFAAAVAAADHWGRAIGSPLRLAAATGWILYAIAGYGERILDRLQALRADIDIYGNHRHSEGVMDGMAQQPATGSVRGIR